MVRPLQSCIVTAVHLSTCSHLATCLHSFTSSVWTQSVAWPSYALSVIDEMPMSEMLLSTSMHLEDSQSETCCPVLSHAVSYSKHSEALSKLLHKKPRGLFRLAWAVQVMWSITLWRLELHVHCRSSSSCCSDIGRRCSSSARVRCCHCWLPLSQMSAPAVLMSCCASFAHASTRDGMHVHLAWLWPICSSSRRCAFSAVVRREGCFTHCKCRLTATPHIVSSAARGDAHVSLSTGAALRSQSMATELSSAQAALHGQRQLN